MKTRTRAVSDQSDVSVASTTSILSTESSASYDSIRRALTGRAALNVVRIATSPILRRRVAKKHSVTKTTTASTVSDVDSAIEPPEPKESKKRAPKKVEPKTKGEGKSVKSIPQVQKTRSKPKQNIPSTRQKAPSPKRKTSSPKRKAPSPRRKAPSPKTKTPSQKRQSPSPRRKEPAPKKREPRKRNVSVSTKITKRLKSQTISENSESVDVSVIDFDETDNIDAITEVLALTPIHKVAVQNEVDETDIAYILRSRKISRTPSPSKTGNPLPQRKSSPGKKIPPKRKALPKLKILPERNVPFSASLSPRLSPTIEITKSPIPELNISTKRKLSRRNLYSDKDCSHKKDKASRASLSPQLTPCLEITRSPILDAETLNVSTDNVPSMNIMQNEKAILYEENLEHHLIRNMETIVETNYVITETNVVTGTDFFTENNTDIENTVIQTNIADTNVTDKSTLNTNENNVGEVKIQSKDVMSTDNAFNLRTRTVSRSPSPEYRYSPYRKKRKRTRSNTSAKRRRKASSASDLSSEVMDVSEDELRNLTTTTDDEHESSSPISILKSPGSPSRKRRVSFQEQTKTKQLYPLIMKETISSDVLSSDTVNTNNTNVNQAAAATTTRSSTRSNTAVNKTRDRSPRKVKKPQKETPPRVNLRLRKDHNSG